MPMRRHSGGAGGVSPPPAQRSDEATSLSDLIAGLADLDANGLRLQWRNHLGGTYELPRGEPGGSQSAAHDEGERRIPGAAEIQKGEDLAWVCHARKTEADPEFPNGSGTTRRLSGALANRQPRNRPSANIVPGMLRNHANSMMTIANTATARLPCCRPRSTPFVTTERQLAARPVTTAVIRRPARLRRRRRAGDHDRAHPSALLAALGLRHGARRHRGPARARRR